MNTRKKVLVKMTVTYPVEVPSHWDKQDVEFYRNEASWCARNALDELLEIYGEDGCMCNDTHFECLGGYSKLFLDENRQVCAKPLSLSKLFLNKKLTQLKKEKTALIEALKEVLNYVDTWGADFEWTDEWKATVSKTKFAMGEGSES